jgi:hypothetical protein
MCGVARRFIPGLLVALGFAMAVTAPAASPLSGDRWVQDGLAVSIASIEKPALSPGGVAISTDGKSFTYSVARSRVSENLRETEFLL